MFANLDQATLAYFHQSLSSKIRRRDQKTRKGHNNIWERRERRFLDALDETSIVLMQIHRKVKPGDLNENSQSSRYYTGGARIIDEEARNGVNDFAERLRDQQEVVRYLGNLLAKKRERLISLSKGHKPYRYGRYRNTYRSGSNWWNEDKEKPKSVPNNPPAVPKIVALAGGLNGKPGGPLIPEEIASLFTDEADTEQAQNCEFNV